MARRRCNELCSGSATDVLVEAARAAGTIWDIKATYPNGVAVQFVGFVQEYTKAIPLEDRLTATVGLRVTGDVTIVAASARPTPSRRKSSAPRRWAMC